LRMSKILGDISSFKKSPPPPPLFSSGDSDDGGAMDVDQPDDDSARRKSLKRRRDSKTLDERSGDGGPSMPTQEELDKVLERLVHMENVISTLQNDLNEHGREAKEEFELLVAAKLRERKWRSRRLGEERQQMQDLEQDITLSGEQVGELASEIGDLIMRVGKLELEVGASRKGSRKGRQESFEKVLQVVVLFFRCFLFLI
jgi:hypothetical protein